MRLRRLPFRFQRRLSPLLWSKTCFRPQGQSHQFSSSHPRGMLGFRSIDMCSWSNMPGKPLVISRRYNLRGWTYQWP